MKTKIFMLFAALSFVAAAHGINALLVNLKNGTTESVSFEDIQNLSFADDELSVKTLGDNTALYAIDNIEKITFGNVIIVEVNNLPVPNNIDAIVYYTPLGEVVVESPIAIQSLTLLSVNGEILRIVALRTTPRQTTINISALPIGIYLLQIETMQGTVVKKIIKN